MSLQQIDLGKVQGDGIPQGGQPGQGIMIDDNGQIIWTTLKAESIEWDNVLNTPATYNPAYHTHTSSEISDIGDKYASKKHLHTTSDISDINRYTLASVTQSLATTINKVGENVEKNKNNINKLLDRAAFYNQYSWTTQIAGGAETTLTKTLKSYAGYEAAGVVGYSIGGINRWLVDMQVTSDLKTVKLVIFNNGATETNTVFANVLYVKKPVTL